MARRPPPPYMALLGHEGAVTALHFTNEIVIYEPFTNEIKLNEYQPVLISGSEIGEIIVWNLKTFRIAYRFKGHNGKKIMFLSFYKSSILSQGRDGFINRWEYDQEWTVAERFPFNSNCVGFCASVVLLIEDMPRLLYLNDDEHILRIGNLKISDTVEEVKFDNKLGMCLCINAFFMYGKIFTLAGFENGCIGLFNCKSKHEICRLNLQEEAITCMDFDSEHQSMGISGSVNGFLDKWELTEHLELIKMKRVEINERGTSAIKIRHDGLIVITAGIDSVIRIFSWKTLKLLATLMFQDLPIQCLAFCPFPIKELMCERKSVFASGSKDKTICLWDIY